MDKPISQTVNNSDIIKNTTFTEHGFGQLVSSDDIWLTEEIETAAKNGQPDTGITIIGSVIKYKTIRAGSKTYLLAEIIGSSEENWWVILEQGTQNCYWLLPNSEFVDYTSENEILFKTTYNRAVPDKFFPSNLRCLKVGKDWQIKYEPIYLPFSESVDFGIPGMQSDDEHPLNLLDTKITYTGLQYVTSVFTDSAPYTYITTDATTGIMTIRLMNCNSVNKKIISGDNLSWIKEVEVKQDGRDSVLTMTMRGKMYAAYYNAKGDCTPTQFDGVQGGVISIIEFRMD